MHRGQGVDLEATEMAIRTAMLQVGGVFLQQLLDADTNRGYRGPRIPCGHGHEAQFVNYRSKRLTTVLSPVDLSRAYYHCAPCAHGLIPRDQELDIVGTSFSPGARRLMSRVGSKESFRAGQEDLAVLAELPVNSKAVERISEATGEQAEAWMDQERQAIWTGKLRSLIPAVPKLYIAMDGTGVPMISRETAGHTGKGEDGKAHTREAKLGCVFSQTREDDQGRPVRDPASTTYTGAIEGTKAFGIRLYAEAVRRGLEKATLVIVLGDGAPWIWNLVAEHFPGAVCIVDLYHAREHLADIAKLTLTTKQRQNAWLAESCRLLDAGEVEQVIEAVQGLPARSQAAREEIRKTAGYFQTNMERMRYNRFRSLGLFVGSGVVEAGCKTLIQQRLKQAGMHWSVAGANAIIALRCCELSGRLEDYWEARSHG